MKNKRKEYLQSLAQEILLYEKEISCNKNVEENRQKIEDIMTHLSLNEMFQLDEYINNSSTNF